MRKPQINTSPYQYFFVYGTLRRSLACNRNRLLRVASRFVGMGKYQGKLYDLGKYPGCVHSSSSGDLVIGEIYKIIRPRNFFHHIDIYEEYTPGRKNQEYRRAKVPIRTDTGRLVSAWIYLYRKPVKGLKYIESGDFQLSLLEKRKQRTREKP